MGHLPSKRCCAADPCYFDFQVDHISLDRSNLFPLWSCLDGDNSSYIGVGVVQFFISANLGAPKADGFANFSSSKKNYVSDLVTYACLVPSR